jgi:hypothetical protein
LKRLKTEARSDANSCNARMRPEESRPLDVASALTSDCSGLLSPAGEHATSF